MTEQSLSCSSPSGICLTSVWLERLKHKGFCIKRRALLTNNFLFCSLFFNNCIVGCRWMRRAGCQAVSNETSEGFLKVVAVVEKFQTEGTEVNFGSITHLS